MEAGNNPRCWRAGLEQAQWLWLFFSYGELTAARHSKPELVIKRQFPSHRWEEAACVQRRLERGEGCRLLACLFSWDAFMGLGKNWLVKVSSTKIALERKWKRTFITSHRGERSLQRGAGDDVGKKINETSTRHDNRLTWKGEKRKGFWAAPGLSKLHQK